MTNEQKQYLLKLARQAISYYLEKGERKKVNEKEVDEDLKYKQGTFVTLMINDQLRGCIGHIMPIQELYKDVIDNAIGAAFEDPRFPALTKQEFDQVKIEISVLDLPKNLDYENAEDLIQKLEKDKPGVILKSGLSQATFLPQVWEDLKEPKEFLSHLSMKAGLDEQAWKEGDVEILVYGVEKFEES